jgi:hypothetical protein
MRPGDIPMRALLFDPPYTDPLKGVYIGRQLPFARGPAIRLKHEADEIDVLLIGQCRRAIWRHRRSYSDKQFRDGTPIPCRSEVLTRQAGRHVSTTQIVHVAAGAMLPEQSATPSCLLRCVDSIRYTARRALASCDECGGSCSRRLAVSCKVENQPAHSSHRSSAKQPLQFTHQSTKPPSDRRPHQCTEACRALWFATCRRDSSFAMVSSTTLSDSSIDLCG